MSNKTARQWAETPTVIVFAMVDPPDLRNAKRNDQIIEALFRQCEQMASDEGKKVVGADYRLQILPMSQSPLTGDTWHLTTAEKAQKMRVLVERPVISSLVLS